MDLGDRVLGSALGTEPVGARLEVRLEDRLEHQLQGGLHHPVPGGRDAQPSGACRSLWGSSVPAPAAGRTGGLEIVSQLGEERLLAPATIERGLSRHRPRPMRAPRLPRTRSQATARKAGSADEVEQVIEPTIRIVGRPIGAAWSGSPVPAPQPRSRLGHGASVFTGDLLAFQSLHCGLAAVPSPCGRLSRPRTTTEGSAPSRGHQPTAGLPADQLAAGRGGQPRDGSHVHHAPVDGIGAQLSPAASPRVRRRPSPWPPHRRSVAGFGVAVARTHGDGRALLPGPHPPGWSRFHA